MHSTTFHTCMCIFQCCCCEHSESTCVQIFSWKGYFPSVYPGHMTEYLCPLSTNTSAQTPQTLGGDKGYPRHQRTIQWACFLLQAGSSSLKTKRKVRKHSVVSQKIRSDSGVLAENEVGLLSTVILSKQSINRHAQTVLWCHCVQKLFHVMFVSRMFFLKTSV